MISQKENDVGGAVNLPPAWLQSFLLPALLGDKGKLSHLIRLNLVEADP